MLFCTVTDTTRINRLVFSSKYEAKKKFKSILSYIIFSITRNFKKRLNLISVTRNEVQ